MNIDFYSIGDPWNPKTWSGTPYEMVKTYENMGILGRAIDINRGQSLLSKVIDATYYLLGLRVYQRKVVSLRGRDTRYCKIIASRANRIYNSLPKPDTIITIGDIGVFKAPYFTFQDLDVDTVIKWRKAKRNTYMFDHYPVKKLLKYRKWEVDIYKNAVGILVASKWVARNIKSYLDEQEKVHAVGIGHRYSPISLTDELVQKRFEKPMILFVGKDGIRKGIDIVIKAIPQVREEIPEIKIELVTDTRALSDNVKKEAEKELNISLHHDISLKSLKKLYQESSLFVMPSRFEPWGKVFFEAMAHGMPVIGANCCAMPEFIRDMYNGYLADYSPESVAEKIINILKSSERYKKMANNALSISKEYTWSNITAKVLKDYLE